MNAGGGGGGGGREREGGGEQGHDSVLHSDEDHYMSVEGGGCSWSHAHCHAHHEVDNYIMIMLINSLPQYSNVNDCALCTDPCEMYVPIENAHCLKLIRYYVTCAIVLGDR